MRIVLCVDCVVLCVFRNNTNDQQTCMLTVLFCVTAEKPKLDMSRVKDITVKAGQDFKMAIPFTGTPKPTASWQLNDADVPTTANIAAKVSAGVVCGLFG